MKGFHERGAMTHLTSRSSAELRHGPPGVRYFAQEERVLERDLPEPVVAAGRAAMAGAKVRLEEERVRVGLRRAELGDELRSLPIGHLTVIERDLDEHRRIAL